MSKHGMMAAHKLQPASSSWGAKLENTANQRPSRARLKGMAQSDGMNGLDRHGHSRGWCGGLLRFMLDPGGG